MVGQRPSLLHWGLVSQLSTPFLQNDIRCNETSTLHFNHLSTVATFDLRFVMHHPITLTFTRLHHHLVTYTNPDHFRHLFYIALQ